MKTQEIEIQHVQIEGRLTEVDYTIYEDDIAIEDKHETIQTKALIAFLVAKEMNVYCENELTGEYRSLDAETYLIENTDMVVTEYLNTL